jgi:hypothetical protein
MKYSFLINQGAIQKWNLSVEHLFFIEWFRAFSETLNSEDKPVMKYIIIDKKMFYWISISKALEDLPCIYKTRGTLSTHIKELIKKGFLIKYLDKENGNKLYFAFGIEYYKYKTYLETFVPPCTKNVKALAQKTSNPCTKNVHNNIVNDSIVINIKKSGVNPKVSNFCERFEAALADKYPERLRILKKSKSYRATWEDSVDKLLRIDGVTETQLESIISSIENGTCGDFTRGFLFSPIKLRAKDNPKIDPDQLPVVWRILRQIKPNANAAPAEKVKTPEQERTTFFNQHIWEYIRGERDIQKDIDDKLIDAGRLDQVKKIIENN